MLSVSISVRGHTNRMTKQIILVMTRAATWWDSVVVLERLNIGVMEEWLISENLGEPDTCTCISRTREKKIGRDN
jgi:hypothetical protein